MQRKICQRIVPQDAFLSGDLHNILRRVYAARHIQSIEELDYSLANLLPGEQMKGMGDAAALLARSIKQDQRILIVGDFDTDGATSCALAVRTLKRFGARHVQYLVPNRFEYGYGLSPEIVEVARRQSPDLILTVDNGISSLEGVAHARSLGIEVLITDHHLPGQTLPDATVIVNPNQAGDPFPSKCMAGVGVCFMVMISLRAHLRSIGWFDAQQIADVNLAQGLDLVALGTVADVVPLDYNNRILVAQGLARIRAGNCCPGISALLSVAHQSQGLISASDLGFRIAPRLNAAGRLQDMSIGIECLLTDDRRHARRLAVNLDQLNLQRRRVQKQMEDSALELLKKDLSTDPVSDAALCLYDEGWHQGVIGILAAHLKEQYYRPAIIFASDQEHLLKGSGRSIEGVHMRDTLERISNACPGLIIKFGGHAMAAGLTIRRTDLERFRDLFIETTRQQLHSSQLENILLTDGELGPEDMNLAFAKLVCSAGPWGSGFPEPLFNGQFMLMGQQIFGQQHLRLDLAFPDRADHLPISAVIFNFGHQEKIPEHTELNIVYRLNVNTFGRREALQLIVEQYTLP